MGSQVQVPAKKLSYNPEEGGVNAKWVNCLSDWDCYGIWKPIDSTGNYNYLVPATTDALKN